VILAVARWSASALKQFAEAVKGDKMTRHTLLSVFLAAPLGAFPGKKASAAEKRDGHSFMIGPGTYRIAPGGEI
jgi:hypothetical protein